MMTSADFNYVKKNSNETILLQYTDHNVYKQTKNA